MDADQDNISDEFADLTETAQSNLDFWENSLDDEDWNDAATE